METEKTDAVQPGWADRTFEGGTRGLLGCLALPALGILGIFIFNARSDDASFNATSASPESVASKPAIPTPSYDTAQRSMICRAGIAAEFGRSHKIMKARDLGKGITRVEYRRPGDAKLWKADCRVDGDRIVWRTVDAFDGSGAGRWRIEPEDDVLIFTIVGNTVTTVSSDGSSESGTYNF